MITKLHNPFKAKTFSACRNAWLTQMFVILLALGGVSELLASGPNNNSTTNLEEFNSPQIVKSYTITDASTVDKACFPTKGEGVIFQRADGCQGSHHIWKVKDELVMNEYDDNTARIIGSVIDDLGKIGQVNIELFNKNNQGNTWNASCYVDGITDPRTLYQDFNGTITVDGHAYTVEPKVSEQHYIVADGAGFEPGQFGFGAWTAGTFGGCTEWFGNLEEIPVPCDVTANAGNDVSISFGDSTTLTATGGESYIWSTGETTASITVTPTETTTYSVMVTSDIGECTDADQVVVTVDCTMEVDLGDDVLFCEETETVLTANVTNMPTYTKIIAAYNITDADTSNGICENVHGDEQGVILQKNNPDFPVTTGRYNAWKVHEALVLNEYDNNTAKITGSIIDENGNIGIVDVLLFDKQSQGKSWAAECYLNGLVGPQLFYQSFHGTIIVDKEIYTVEPKKSGHHFVLAEGASLEQNQFGFGAWTSGTWGVGGEWFGNLDPIEIENCEAVSYLWSTGETTASITVSKAGEYAVTVKNCNDCEATDSVSIEIMDVKADAGDDVTICLGDTTILEVEGEGTYLWSNGATTQSIEVSPEASSSYSVTVTNGQCEATDGVTVTVENATAHACDDVTICLGETTTLAVEGEGTYLWSTGATTQSIEVSPEATTTYSVTVTNGQCEAIDDVTVTVEDKMIIGDYVWLDENRNGLQDDGATGINDINVKLYQCTTGDFIEVTKTKDGANGAGYYEFQVCQNSGEYYIVFGDVPTELEFTTNATSDTLNDSNADEDGRTACFTIAEEDDLSIDAGLIEVCDLNVDAGEEAQICTNSNSLVELTATIEDGTAECPGGCVYPVISQDRCFGPTGDFEIWLNSKGGISSWKFKASEQRFEVLANGNARYTATASNGIDNIEMDVTFSGYTTTPTLGSPKLNDCQEYDTSDWEYWTTWNGTITSENHGVYTMEMMGAPFQMGVGADVTRSGFGASGWFSTTGGDGFYTIGDVNIPLAECQENGVEYKWTTIDGSIVSDPYKKTIAVDAPGTYVFEAMNCVDCFSTDKVVVSAVNCKVMKSTQVEKISKVYPIPVASGGRLTIEFGQEVNGTTTQKSFGPQLEEDVSMVVYDMNGRMISIPRSFKMVDGKAIIHLDIDSIPSGKYIVRAQGNNWAESKHILVK